MQVLDDTLSSAVHDENINEFMVKADASFALLKRFDISRPYEATPTGSFLEEPQPFNGSAAS